MSHSTSNAGIAVDENSGERQIPESTRADGSKRKAIKIRPGYQPPEDVQVYKNRTAEAFRDRASRIGIPGATGLKEEQPDQGGSAASNKNAKRREARRKAKAVAGTDGGSEPKSDANSNDQQPKTDEVDPEAEREKKARSLKKKLKQAKDLKMKKDGGEGLLPEQIAKVIKINELIRELDLLGFDSEGEPKGKSADGVAEEQEKK